VGERMTLRESVGRVWSNPYVRVAFAVVVVVLIAQVFVRVRPAGTLFLAGLGVAYVLNPVVDWLQARGVHRAFGVSLVAIALIALSSLVATLSVTAIRNTITEADGGVTLTESAMEVIENLPANLERLLPASVYGLLAEPLSVFGNVVRQGGEALAPYLEGIGTALYGFVSGTVTGAAFAGLVLVLTVYVLYDFHRFSAALLQVWPRPYQETVGDLARTLDQVFGGYIRGQLVIAIAVGLMVFVGLALIGLPLAGFIGLLAGVLNVVPFLGTIIPVVPALVVAIAAGWWQVALVVVVFVVANQVDNHVITPMVLSKSTRLHPVTVILAVIGGFAAGGLLAAIFAVPIVAFVKGLYVERYLQSRFYREG